MVGRKYVYWQQLISVCDNSYVGQGGSNHRKVALMINNSYKRYHDMESLCKCNNTHLYFKYISCEWPNVIYSITVLTFLLEKLAIIIIIIASQICFKKSSLGQRRSGLWDKEEVDFLDTQPLKTGSIPMKFSMKKQEKGELLILVTA